MRRLEYCCFLNRSGYASASLDYIYALKSLDKFDIKISLFHPLPDQLSLSPQRYQEVIQMMRKERAENAVQILHCIPEKQPLIPRLKKNLAFATFETFDPPQNWISILNRNEAVICPSEFNVKIFQHAGINRPIHYVPHCFNPNEYHSGVEPLYKDERFTFMFIGTWRRRKGYAQLLEAWMKEFDINDPVRLMIKTDRFTMANRTIQEVKTQLGLTKKEIAPIVFEGRVLSESQIPQLLKSADCLICPTLGEGFGLPGLQCMALGVPVAITNFSGCTEYANEQTATLIEPDNYIVYGELDGLAQFRNKKWAHITVDSVRKALRYVIDNTDKVKEKAKIGQQFVLDRFSYPIVAKKLQMILELMSTTAT